MDFISTSEEKQTIIKKPLKTSKKYINLNKDKSSSSSVTKNKFRKMYPGGVIYIGHIPHGFYEDEMRSYFNQFGKVIATKVARSKKTGRSKGYGFVKFKDEEVAKIAAETMNNYLMFNKIIKCRYIPPKEIKGNLFRTTIRIGSFPKQVNRVIELRNKTKALSKLTPSTYLQKTQKKLNGFKKFFENHGIDFTFKLSDENCQDNEKNKTKSTFIFETKSLSTLEKKTDDFKGVLEIDEEDNDIFFKTPPQVKKVIKKSQTSVEDQKDLILLNDSIKSKVTKDNSNFKKIFTKNKKIDASNQTPVNIKTLIKSGKKKILKLEKTKNLDKSKAKKTVNTTVRNLQKGEKNKMKSKEKKVPQKPKKQG